MAANDKRVDLETSPSFKAIFASSVFHAILLALNITFEAPELKIRTDAIEVKMVKLEDVQKKNKVLKEKSPFKESEVIKKPLPEKVVAGTQKVIPKSDKLGDPNAKTVQKVQKGDPLSKDFSKYKPDTDFRKLKSANIGTGAAGPKLEGAKTGGGSGDTYKGLDFATKSLTNNGRLGERFKIKNAADDMGAGAGKGGGIGDGVGRGFGDGTITGSPNGTLEKAKILTNVGSLTGAVSGTIASSKGAEGLSQKGAIVFSGSPQETVVLGTMDPNVIRQILLDHLAQFRYCYQSELESNEQADKLSGVVQLNFDINQSGNVGRSNVGGSSAINQKVKSCVNTVLRGIQFPSPKGGGRVEVKQPMNFFPKQF